MDRKSLYFYISKCLTGCLIVFGVASLIDYRDFGWCIISVMLVLTPESKEALPLAITRIKANLIGGSVSVLCLLIAPANVFTICLAITITILGCYYFKLMDGSRAAIAAVIIIMLHGLEYKQVYFWSATIERVISVIAGCAIGLLVTLLFHKRILNKKEEGKKSEEA